MIALFHGASGRAQPASGPVRSLMALMEGLKDQADFVFVTGAGLADALRAEGALPGRARLVAVAPGGARLRKIRSVLRALRPDLVMLSGFFDRDFTMPVLLLRRLGLAGEMPILLAPRGEFAPGALALKAGRKRLWLAAARRLGLTRSLWLHATADHERADIAATGLSCRGVVQAPNARLLGPLPEARLDDPGAGPLRLVFLGRITPVKNLHLALDALALVQAPVALDIFGPIVDHGYWADCEARIARLPAHVGVRYCGVASQTMVIETLSAYDLFLLPTSGENFGHAIAEALSAGLPVLIADTTPWRGLAAMGAGWDLPPEDPSAFAARIDEFASYGLDRRRTMRSAARRLAERSHAQGDALAANARMFRAVLENAPGAATLNNAPGAAPLTDAPGPAPVTDAPRAAR